MAKKEKKVESVEVETEEQEPTVEVVEAEQDSLQTELETAQEELKVAQDLYLRTLADMDNLRKRTQREKEELGKFANENILREILPVVDNLERALEHAKQAHSGEGLLEGVQMTLTQFSQVLQRFGVAPVQSMGQNFDPALHQAMGQLETAEQPVNTVVQELQKGYVLNERLLRPSMVMVAKAPAVSVSEDETSTETDDK